MIQNIISSVFANFLNDSSFLRDTYTNLASIFRCKKGLMKNSPSILTGNPFQY